MYLAIAAGFVAALELTLLPQDGRRYSVGIAEDGTYEKRRLGDDHARGELVGCGRIRRDQLEKLRKLAEIPGKTGAKKRTEYFDDVSADGHPGFALKMIERKTDSAYYLVIASDGRYETREEAVGKESDDAGVICREPFQDLRRWLDEGGLKKLRIACPSENSSLPHYEIQIGFGKKTMKVECHRTYARMPAPWREVWDRVASAVAKGGKPVR